MKNKILNFLWKLAIIGALLAAFNYLIYRILPEKHQPEGLIGGHVFLFLLTLVNYIALSFLMKKKREYMGFGFIAASFLKMIIVVVYMLPVIIHQNSATYSYVFQFFGLYFCYLAFEVLILTRDLKRE